MECHRSVVHSEDYAKPSTLLKERRDHNTSELHGLLFSTSVWDLSRPTEFMNKGFDTEPTVYGPYQRRLDSLGAGPAGVELNLPHGNPRSI